MKFIVNTFSSIGHVSSVGPIVAELRSRGHEIVWLSGIAARPSVEKYGATFVKSDALDWHNRPPLIDEGASGLDAAVSQCRAIFIESLEPLVRDLKEVLIRFPADVVFTDIGGHGAAILHEMGGPVYSTIFHVPACHWNHGPDIVSGASEDDDQNPFTHWIGTPKHTGIIKALVDQERSKFDLPSLDQSFMFKDLATSPFLNIATTTASLEFPEQHIEPHSWKVGPVFPDSGTYDTSSWLHLVNDGRFVIHVTQGTFNDLTTDSKNLIEPTISAFGNKQGVLIVATGAGLQHRYAAGEFPSNVYCQNFIPHAALLPHVDIMITNAGFGGVLAALRHGVPLVCAGRGQDKADVSDLVSWRKVGIDLHTNFPTAAQISQAVESIRNDERYSINARKIEEDFARSHAPKTAADLLERLAQTQQEVRRPEEELGMFHLNRHEIQPVERGLLDFISDHTRSAPTSAAIDAHDGQMTYLELDEAANAVSDALKQSGVMPGDMVPTCFSKSKHMIVAMLGILKCSAAFVPLDPLNPKSRLREILGEVKAKIVIGAEEHKDMLSGFLDQVMIVKDSGTRISSPSRDALIVESNHSKGSGVAYVIFTSGSTGKPKGVMVDDLAICTSLAEQCSRFQMNSSTRMLQFMSTSFDASILETLGTLLSGGCICIPSDADKLDDLAGVMRQLRVNTAVLTPSLATLVKPEKVPALTTLLVGGESLRKEVITTWAGRASVFNGYGPTEASVLSTAYSIDCVHSSTDMIGTALACHVWVVDKDDHEIPLTQGEIGELLVEGPILARGYLNDDEKTQNAFVSPTWLQRFRKRHNVRVYKTGDLVTMDSKGSVRYIERKDLQVKLRGNRVEIGEVEHHMSAALSAEERCAAILPKSGPLSGRLVGVVMPNHSPTVLQEIEEELANPLKVVEKPEFEKLEGYLRKCLPSYMIPSTIVQMDILPVQISGKLDRKGIQRCLEKFGTSRAGEDEPVVPKDQPRTTAESAIESVLHLLLPNLPGNINLDKSFKQIGGDSFLAMDAIGRLRAKGVPVRFDDLFSENTLSGLAKKFDDSLNNSGVLLNASTSGKVEDTSKPNDKTATSLTTHCETVEFADYEEWIDLSPVQQMYFKYLQWPVRFHSSQGLVLKNEPLETVIRSIDGLVRRHEMLRAQFEVLSESWRQRVRKFSSGCYNVFIHDHTSTRDFGDELVRAHDSIDITEGLVFAAVIHVTLNNEVESLYLIAHHLVVDLRSWQIVLGELDADLRGEEIFQISLPFTRWQKLQSGYGRNLEPAALLPAEILPAPVVYWGIGSADSLLYGRSEQHKLKDMVGLDFELASDIVQRMLTRCAESTNLHLIDVLLAGFISSFYQTFSDRKEVCVWNQLHGRSGVWDEDIDISGTVGWFNIFVPIYLDRSTKDIQGKELNRLIEAVHAYRDSIPSNGLPYFSSRAFNQKGQETARNHMPMEVVFNYTGRSMGASNSSYRSFKTMTKEQSDRFIPDIDPEFKLTHILDIVVEMDESESLKCKLGFDRLLRYQDKLRCLWDTYETVLTGWVNASC